MISDQDQRSRRCPRLGHSVRFQYCRTQAEDELCPLILDCWWETFDVREFLIREGKAEDVAALQSRQAPPKLASLADLIESARRRTAADSESGEQS